MKSGILRLVGACAAAFAIASSASPMVVSLTEASSGALGVGVLDTLEVSLSSLGGQIVTGYDLYISYDTLAPGDIVGVFESDALFGTLGIDLFNSDTTTPGLILGQDVSIDSNAGTATTQGADPLLLFKVQFDADIQNVNFGPSTANASDVACAQGEAGTVQCFPASQAPEPASIALVLLALVGAGLASRRRRPA